jgi:glycerophosphoryl diester phosphodiesterase
MQSSPSRPDPLDPGPAGFAHRGLHQRFDVPENSLAAFAAAVELGAGIECDLRLTADNRILVIHDSTAWRMCSSPLAIGRSTLAELSLLRVGEQRIPTLDDLLELVNGRVPLLLEVKVGNDVRRWPSALKRTLAGYDGRFGVMSFDARLGRLLKARLPSVPRGLVIRQKLKPWPRRLAFWLADPDFIAVERAALREDWVAQARERMPVYSWTIKGPVQRKQAEVHADALIWEADGRP